MVVPLGMRTAFYMLCRTASVQPSVQKVGSLVLPGDAGRLGRPAEENLILSGWDQNSGYGFVLPNQAAPPHILITT